MASAKLIERVPWDCAALNCDAYELKAATPEAMTQMSASGHYTVKVDPLAPKAILHQNGFYYCDTLIEPYCAAAEVKLHPHAAAAFTMDADLDSLLAMCRGAFRHDRFHRDFNVEPQRADLRYENWLRTLYGAGKVYGLLWEGVLAGFIAREGGKLVLHVLGEKHRGRGVARHLWSAVCSDLVKKGEGELSSSISATNLPALNLYALLGFDFRNSIDVYHRVIR